MLAVAQQRDIDAVEAELAELAAHLSAGTARFPSCTAKRAEAHHIQHWSKGGVTSTDNLILLCRTHHRLVHEGGFTISARAPGDVEFRRPDGRPVTARETTGDANRLRALNTWASISPDTSKSLWDGGRPDYRIAVEGLFLLREGNVGPVD